MGTILLIVLLILLFGGGGGYYGYSHYGGTGLTDDDVDVIAGKRDILLGKIQEKHGMAREEAEKELKAWEDSLK